MDNTINKDVITFFIKLLLYDYKHYKPDEQLIETIVKHTIHTCYSFSIEAADIKAGKT